MSNLVSKNINQLKLRKKVIKAEKERLSGVGTINIVEARRFLKDRIKNIREK